MKKSILALTIATLSILSTKQVNAQLWLMTDGGIFFTKDLVGEGINLKAGWHYGEYDYNMVTLGGGYNLLAQKPLDIVVVDTTGLLTDTIESFLVTNLISIDGDYRRYFFQTDADDYFAFYGIAGISLWLVNTKVNLGPFVDSVFAVQEGATLVASNMSVRMPLGFGMDWTVRGRFWWYFEAKIEVPFTQVNNEYIGNDFGVSYHFTTGARFLLHDFYR